MFRHRLVAALLIGGIVAACGNTPSPTTPAASDAANPNASTIAVAGPTSSPSPSPSATASPSPTATPIPTPTPTATPTPPPPPWKKFTSKRYHYTIKYPPTWIATPGSAGISDQFDAYDYPYVYVSRDTVSGTISVSRTVTHEIAITKTHFKAKLTSNSAITIAGWSGRLLKYTGSDNGLKIELEQIVVAKGSVVYFLDLIGRLKESTADRALFKKMNLTWRAT
jgi:hypothetical protein